MWVIMVKGDKVRQCATEDELKRALLFIKNGVVRTLSDCGKLPSAEKDSLAYADERINRHYQFHGGVTVRTMR